MTAEAQVEILAHHGLLLAIPAFAPAVAVAGVVIYIAVRDRRRKSDARLKVRTLTLRAKMVPRETIYDSCALDGRGAHHRGMRRIGQF